MEVKDWESIENLFHAALRLSAAERAAYLDRACVGKEALRSEVESLLVAFSGRDNFMEEPAFALGMKVLASDTIELLTGELIGPYKILNQLGEGGMGEVYLAEDTRLGRKVALKFLSAKLVDDNWAKRQLVKEAQSVAMLDHPNICAVHGIEEAGGYSFIVMQYVEGETLAALIHKQLPNITQAVSFAIQIVSAVAEAHAHGIIHRDIKSRNIMVSSGGQVKVLDFGLAKTVQRKHGEAPLTDDTSRISNSSLVVGTVGYMSPEQLRAERLDFRSDIFSLGTVLYELVSGKKPFARNSDAEVISAILTSRPPPLTRVPNDVPPELNRIIFRCLEKDKEKRYQSASEVLYELNGLRTGREFTRRRQHRPGARTVAALVLLVLVTAALSLAYLRLTRVQTLAVLPIAYANADPKLESLSDGLTEDLINKLSHLSKLRVKAFTVVSGYKGQSLSPQEVGRSLKVDAVLTGAFVRQGETLVLQTSLIDTSDGSQLWGEKYDVRQEQVLDLPENVFEKVVSNLSLWVGEGEKKQLAERPTQNNEALREYYKGRQLWYTRNKQNIQEAVAHFQKAVDLDPSYARAYAGLADCYVLLNTVAYGSTPTDEAMKKARASALQALEIDETLPEAHTALGVVKLKYEWNWLEAEKEFKRAIALNPDYAWAHYWYSQLLVVTDRQDDALAQSQTASDLAPFSPLASMGRCRALYYARQFERAADCSNEVLAKNPNNVSAQYVLSYTYLQKGMYDDAIGILEKLYTNDKALAAAPLGFAYGRSGRTSKALDLLNDMREMAKGVYLPPEEAAIVYIGLDNKNEAFAWLERSYAERFTTLIFLTTDPIYDSLHSDPRFADLARRLNLAPHSAPS
ncbi:MAG TPA: protein kinase [Pyrinomonadaceae bacterium]|jgi:serine/threonine-protein kinase